MAISFTTRDTDCQHPQWCRAKLERPHSAECPVTVLGLSDGDVEAFCVKHVKTVGSILVGEYDGRRATSTNFGTRSRRWLAENLLMHAKLGTPRL